MKKILSFIISSVLILMLATGLAGCDRSQHTQHTDHTETSGKNDNGNTYSVPDEGGTYTSMSEVSAYIHEYGHLPDNYITKSEAKKLGWKSESANLWDVAPGKSIGGDSFGNREGLLPKTSGRKYYECDIDYKGGARNAKRLVYSNDGLIYYTQDHYQSYTQLY